jgi:transcriptional regulator with XRE-family HTH domain
MQGISQAKAAKLFGISQPAVSEYEGGKTPRTDIAVTIACVTRGVVPVPSWVTKRGHHTTPRAIGGS